MELVEDALRSEAFGIDPYPTYAVLRERAPVYWSDAWHCWLVTRYDDVIAILRQPQLFSNAGRVTTLLSHLSSADQARFQPLQRHFAGGMVHTDPPEHTRLRKIVTHAFAPRVISQLRPRIAQIVGELIDAFAGNETFDLIGDFAYPLPAIVISELFGAPQSDRHLFKRWSTDIGAFQGAGRSDMTILEPAQESLVEMRAYFRQLAHERQARPSDDLLSTLVQPDESGERLTENELLSVCVTMLTAGHETTTSLIGNGMLALLRQPEQLALLRRHPDLIPNAVEEFLRFDSPLQRTWRRVASEVTFGGQTLQNDQLVVVMLGAANRDPTAFPDPDRLDIQRETRKQIALGYGVHFCLGAALARLEGQIAFGELLQRLPELKGEVKAVEWQVGGVFRCLRTLQLSC